VLACVEPNIARRREGEGEGERERERERRRKRTIEEFGSRVFILTRRELGSLSLIAAALLLAIQGWNFRECYTDRPE